MVYHLTLKSMTKFLKENIFDLKYFAEILHGTSSSVNGHVQGHIKAANIMNDNVFNYWKSSPCLGTAETAQERLFTEIKHSPCCNCKSIEVFCTVNPFDQEPLFYNHLCTLWHQSSAYWVHALVEQDSAGKSLSDNK